MRSFVARKIGTQAGVRCAAWKKSQRWTKASSAGLEAEVGRLAQAIAGGGEIPALVAAMQERERRCSHLRAEVAAVERQVSVRRDKGDVARALDVMREALTDWQGMLRQETGPARRAMQVGRCGSAA